MKLQKLTHAFLYTSGDLCSAVNLGGILAQSAAHGKRETTVDRAGQRISTLTGDELQAIFEVVSSGGDRTAAMERLGHRNRTTVCRAYNVVSAFHRLRPASLDDDCAAKIATSAKYTATPEYVQRIFLAWQSWTGPEPNGPDGKGHEDPAQAERSGHWPALRETAEACAAGLSEGVPFAQVLGFPWRVWPDYSNVLSIERQGDGVAVSLRAEGTPLFLALREHLSTNDAWSHLTEWKVEASELSRALLRLCDWPKDRPETNGVTWVSEKDVSRRAEGVTEYFTNVVVLDVAEEKCNVQPVHREYELDSVGRGRWTLKWTRNYSTYVILAASNRREELERLQIVHTALRTRMLETAEVDELVKRYHSGENIRKNLRRELDRISLMAKFPGLCSLYSSDR